jgi:hypothetical protein
MHRVLFWTILLPTVLSAQDSVEFIGRYWAPQFHGQVRVDRSGFGTDIDARRDLGVKNTNFPSGEVSWRRGRHRVSFGYTPIEYSGDREVVRTILFGGREYTLGTRVVSNLEVKHLQLGWSWQFIDIRDGLVRLGPLIEADGFLMRGKLSAPSLGFSESSDLSAGLPGVGAALNIRPHPRVELYAQAAGMKAGEYGHFVGSDAGVKVRVWKAVLLTGGYRTFDLHVRSSPDFANFRLHGPFAGAGFRF